MIPTLIKSNELKVNLEKLNTNSGRQRYHVVHGVVRELLARLPGPHKNAPTVSYELGP
jgi:hypothetical protein